MKTNFKTTVLALTLMVGATGAFANNISNAISGKKLLDYSWTTYDRDGNVTGTSIPGNENSFSSCPSIVSDLPCATGTSEEGPTINRYYIP